MMTPPQNDPVDALVRTYLYTEAGLNTDAYEVVTRWYTYLNALSNSIGNQLGTSTPGIGVEAVELAFETPIIGFLGNTFWSRHGATILPLVCADIAALHLATKLGASPDLVFANSILRSYTFIGYVVALVQQDGMASWREFEVKFRRLVADTLHRHLNTGGN